MINVLYLHAGSEMYGADKILLELVSGINKKEFHPIVVLPSNGPLYKHLKEQGIETYIVRYPILRRKYFNLKGIINYVMSYRKSVKEILEIVSDKNINLIHVNTTAVLEGVLLKKKLSVPLLWHIHEILEHPKIIVSVTNFIIGKFSDGIVAVSEATSNHLKVSPWIRNDKVYTIYNGVDSSLFRPHNDVSALYQELEIKKDSLVVGMIGRVNAWKGQQDFLNAVAPVLQQNKQVYVLLVGGVFKGEEWRWDKLENQIAQSLNNERIKLIGFRSDIQDIQSLIDIFVLPSTEPDPFPTVVLEAMASGNPIVGYRHGGVVEMVEDHSSGLLARPNDVTDLSLQINKLVKNKSMRGSMGKQSRKREEQYFSIDAFINKFEKQYKGMILNENK